MKDLLLLVADKSMEFSLQGALDRPQSLGIRPVSFDFRQHPGRDGGVRTSGARLLALERKRLGHALLVLDHEGSGSDATPNEEGKPLRPKEALKTLLPICRRPRSAALYLEIAKRISLRNCSDPAFFRPQAQLKVWFSGE